MKIRAVVAAALAVAVFGVEAPHAAQGPQAIAIVGGTLINGLGGAPVENSAIVIQGNRIVAAGPRAGVAIPAGAQTIEAAGKFILPGLIDSKSNWNFQYGEAYLIWGVTGAIVSGGRNDQGNADRDAINHGIFAGPRLYQTVLGLRGPGPMLNRRQSYEPGAGDIIPYTPEETRQLTRDIIAAGADFIVLGDGDGPPELWAPAVEEAHRAGLAVSCRCMGPQTRGLEASRMGIDVLVHAGNLGSALTTDPERWKDAGNTGRGGPEPTGTSDAFATMDEVKVPEAIRTLVANNTFISPEFVALDRGFYSSAARVRAEAHSQFNDPSLLKYYSDFSLFDLYDNVREPSEYLTAATIAERSEGFKKKADFIRRFVEAGGKVVASSDITQAAPGIGVHQEMAIMQEDVHMPRMKIIQAATKWGADAHRLHDVGSVEPGKFADILILDADPLIDIMNTRKIHMVLKDGKVVVRLYHADYGGSLFANSMQNDDRAVIGGQAWAEALKGTIPARDRFAAGAPAPSPRISPTPGIVSLTPHTIPRLTQGAVVTLKGFSFVKGSLVLVDGKLAPVEIVGHDTIRVTLDPAQLANAGKRKIVVKNPHPVADPDWGDTSNTAFLLVPFEFTTKYFSKGSTTR